MSRAKAKAPAIGIDLGTSYCSVGVFENGKVTILADDEGNRRISSCVALWILDIDRFIEDAIKNKNLASFDPPNTILDVLRLIGCQFEDPWVQDFIKNLPFEVMFDEHGKPTISVQVKGERKLFFPEEICSMLLAKMKKIAEKHLGRPVTDAVVTVPADFNYSQRQAIRDAATIAGLKTIGIIGTPVAAAIAQYFPVSIPKVGERPSGNGTGKRNVLVYDLGGGSFDVSILTIMNSIFEVKSTAGNSHLGGGDFVNRMMTHFVVEIRRKHERDITTRKWTLLSLRRACETAKISLSHSGKAFIKLDASFDGIDLRSSISRSLFEELNADLFGDKVLEPVEKCLQEAMLHKSQIDDVLLLGGSTRIPKIQQLLQQFFNGKELKIMENSEEASAFGAALYAAVLSGDRSEEIKNLLLLNAIPISFGVQTIGGEIVTVIKKNTVIPSKWIQTLKFSTGNQPVLKIKVYEGKAEGMMTKENSLMMGELEFPGFFPVLSQVHVKVAFELDEQSILRVTATEMFTGDLNEVRVTFDKGGFTVEEIERMVKNAEACKKSEAEMRKRLLEFERSWRSPVNKEEIETDFAIVCGSGSEVKCNKAFLCVRSEVLRAMIERSGSEAVTNRIEMADMSEQGVKAFLAFINHRDTPGPWEESGVIFELLRGAHKYDIKDLQSEMKELILAKGSYWLGVENAVRLFAFARHLENGKDLKMKAVEVLKKNISTLDDSDCFKELFQNNPESAMDLYQCSISD